MMKMTNEIRVGLVITASFTIFLLLVGILAKVNIAQSGYRLRVYYGFLNDLRIGAPVMVMGTLVSLAALSINELAVPHFNDKAFIIMRDAYGTAAGGDDMLFEVRDNDGKAERILYGSAFDPDTMTVRGAVILDFTRGDVQILRAEKVRWQGETWVLENAEYMRWGEGGASTWFRDQRVIFDVGRSPDEVARVRKRPEEMSLQELAEQARVEEQRGNDPQAGRLLQHTQVRLAAPWSSLGFAMLGLPLGVRRLRTSRGIGMGLSIAVIFIYYIVMNTLSVLGERTMAHHVLIAWIPNVLLYLGGIGLLLRDTH